MKLFDECTFYIDPTNGKDSNDGSISNPLLTIQKGVELTRNNRSSPTTNCYLYLREGTFYIGNDGIIELTELDSYLSISNYKTEQVSISGGVPLKFGSNNWESVSFAKLDWKVHNSSNNCWGRSGTDTSNDLIEWIDKFETLNECISAIKSSDILFHSFCYNDPSIGGEYAGQCYGVKDQSWQPYLQSSIYSGKFEGRNIWKIQIENANEFESVNSQMMGLRINGKRGIKARYPDTIPETAMQFDPISGWIPYTTQWKAPSTFPAPKDVIYTANNYSNTDVVWPMVTPGFNNTNQYTGMGNWGQYHIGVGGTCNQDGIVPNYGYWCSADSPRGKGYEHTSPSGITLESGKILPNAPYSNITGAIFHAWRPAHWFTMMWEVDNNDNYDGTTNEDVVFSRGGFQGGEGGFSSGAEWYLENVFEELTIPNEYFYNASSNTLYLYYNNTMIDNGSTSVPPPSDIELIATKKQILFNISGSSASSPVKNVTLTGLTFRDTAIGFLSDHGMPSAGDWAIEYQGAISISNSISVVIDSSLFTRIDGNAIFIEGFNRNATVSNNDFEWIGDTVIASIGYTNSVDNNAQIPNAGPDGRNGNQPRFNHISNNMAREIGLYQKQSSLYFQAVSCQSLIENNIFFNGPRAAVNFNDGFGGANIFRNNLVLNAVRESGDHGPFNSWNRIPYITTVADGKTPSIIPAFNQIYQNFMIGTYQTQECIDNDDGSAQYLTYSNFFVYGGNGLKSDFNGNNNKHYDNVYAYIVNAYNAGAYDEFHNNSVVFTGEGKYASTCINVPGFDAYGNELFNENGKMNVCGMSIEQWVAKGNDPGTSINIWPTDQEIIKMAKNILPY